MHFSSGLSHNAYPIDEFDRAGGIYVVNNGNFSSFCLSMEQNRCDEPKLFCLFSKCVSQKKKMENKSYESTKCFLA